MLPTDNTDKITLIRDCLTKARQIKNNIAKGIQIMGSQNISANAVLNFMFELNDCIRVWGEAAAVPNIDALAQDVLRKPGLQFAAELTNLITKSQDVIDWIDSNFPKSPDGYLLKDKIVANSVNVRIFTTAQTAPFRALLQTTLDDIQ